MGEFLGASTPGMNRTECCRDEWLESRAVFALGAVQGTVGCKDRILEPF